jgi:hypothetical protein
MDTYMGYRKLEYVQSSARLPGATTRDSCPTRHTSRTVRSMGGGDKTPVRRIVITILALTSYLV